MDYRKLIKFGDNSFVVSMPKAWLKKNSLEKGDVVYLAENGDNELIIAPTLKEQKQETKQITLHVDGKDFRRIKREIISAYLNNHNIVKITGKDLEENATKIRDIVHNLMALEIIEQTKNEIVIQDFLNIRDISLAELMRKMDIIVRSIMGDLILCLEKDYSDNIGHRGQDVSRMSFVILRAIRKGFKDPEYAKNLKITQLQLFETWNIAAQITFIAEQMREIAPLFVQLKDLPQKEKIYLKTVLKLIEEIYSNVMKAYYSDNIVLANQTSQAKNKLRQELHQILTKMYAQKKANAPMAYIALLDRLSVFTNEINKIARRIYS